MFHSGHLVGFFGSCRAVEDEGELFTHFLGEEGHVETDADLVTLPEIVVFVVVVIDDELFALVALVLGHRNVVEEAVVPGVSKNVITVSSL